MTDSPRVYVACSKADEPRATRLGVELEAAGLGTFVEAWDIVPGNTVVFEKDEAIPDCPAAVLLLGAESRQIAEYPALTHRADQGQLLLVPVLLPGGVVPASLSGRKLIDFSDVEHDREFRRRCPAVVDAVRGAPVPRRSLEVTWERIAEDAQHARLRLTSTNTIMTTPDGTEVSAPHRGLGTGLTQLLWTTARLRGVADGRADRALAQLGADLTRRFLGGDVGPALRSLVAEMDGRNQSLRLGVEAEPAELADLPWECLSMPGAPTPLALHPRVRLHRRAGLGETVLADVPGPLRILAVVACPDHGGGPLLDYEHELSEILDRVEEARRNDAYVRILNWGSVGAIREALTLERFHVLHVSCHARPGELMLETADGDPDPVDALRFADELVVADRGVPLVVLAGCDTARADATNDQLPGYAHTLLSKGVPAVLAMTAPVTDRYATALLSRVYGRLARADGRADPLTALSDVRREIESQRATPPGDPATPPPEWPAAGFFTRVADASLYDGRTPPGPRPARPIARDLAEGIVELDRGEFVGRRVDLRLLLRGLRGRQRGALIFGMGGAGKSSLAVQLVQMLAGHRTVVATLHGRCGPDEVLAEVAGQIHVMLGDDRLHRRLTNRQDDWRLRLRVLGRWIDESGHDVLLLLDDPLGDPILDGADGDWLERELDAETRAFLVAWLRLRRDARLVVTARHRGALGDLGPRLLRHHLGPLSRAETRKMFWRLPALWALPEEARERAYRDLGGHPRALEYLDAVLRAGGGPGPGSRGGSRPFEEIAERMETTLLRRGIDDPESWMHSAGGDVGTAIAEVVAETSADVLLHRILDRLGPAERELLVAASVYRVPVDTTGLQWVVTSTLQPSPEHLARLRRAYQGLLRAQRRWAAPVLDDLDMSADDRAELNRALAHGTLPPEVPGLAAARDALVDIGLLTPMGDDRFVVHRWTAAALAAAEPDAVLQAHRRAAAYRRYWASLYEEVDDYDYADLEEARHHFTAAGDRERMTGVAAELCMVWHACSAWRTEELVCAETLAVIGDDLGARLFRHQLGVIAMVRGDHDGAEEHLRWCLRVAEAGQDPVAVAGTLCELGAVAQLRGDRDEAGVLYRRAIGHCGATAVRDSPPARTVLASCYQQLGLLDLARADGEAWRWSSGARDVATELLDEPSPARTERDLARLARALGDTVRAEQHEVRASEHASVHRDAARLVAAAALQAGAVQLLRGAVRTAVEPLRVALDRATALGDLPLMAQCLQLFGDVLFATGQLDMAAFAFREFAELAVELGDPVRQAVAEQQLGRVVAEAERDDPTDLAAGHLAEAEAIAVRLGDQALIASTHLFRGEVADRAGRPDDAREHFERARGAAGAEDDAVSIAAAVQLGGLAARAGRPERAAEWFARAGGAAARAGNRGAEISCLTALALLDLDGQRTAEAVAKLRAAVRRAEETEYMRAAAGCRIHLGRIASDEGDRATADSEYAAAIALLTEEADPDLLAEAHRHRGRTRAHFGDHIGAMAELELALALSRSGDVALVQLYRCRSALATGDEATAAVAAAEAGALAAGMPPSPLTVIALLAAGEAAGQAPQLAAALGMVGRLEPEPGMLTADCLRALAYVLPPPQAVARLRAALDIAERLGDRLAAMHDWRDLGRAHRDAGNPAAALACLKRSVAGAVGLDPAAPAAARALLRGDDATSALAEVERSWRDQRWVRRVRVLDGERPFTDGAPAYLGPSIDRTLRDMRSRLSFVTGVASVTGPRGGRRS